MDFEMNNSSFDNMTLSQKRDMIMQQVKQQAAMQSAQSMLHKTQEKCFEKCVSKPGTRLDGSEQTCVAKCSDRYLEAWSVVSKAYHGRLQQELLNQGQ